MAAPKKNEFWKARAKHGRDKIFSTPEILWESACEYFQWCVDNPLVETVLQSGKTYRLPKMRAMTESGLSIFLDIDIDTFYDYAKNKDGRYEDFIGVTKKIKEIIRTQKFEGASAGFLNANIIARDLGLRDKHELEHSGEIVTSDEKERRSQELLDEARQLLQNSNQSNS